MINFVLGLISKKKFNKNLVLNCIAEFDSQTKIYNEEKYIFLLKNKIRNNYY